MPIKPNYHKIKRLPNFEVNIALYRKTDVFSIVVPKKKHFNFKKCNDDIWKYCPYAIFVILYALYTKLRINENST